MININVEEFGEFNKSIQREDLKQFKAKDQMKLIDLRSSSLNYENEECLKRSSSETPDLTIDNKMQFIGFQKTVQSLKRIRKSLSIQSLEKVSNQNSHRINDKLSAQYCYCHNNFPHSNWERSQKNEMLEAIMDQYERQILIFKAQLKDLKEDKNDIQQILGTQRRLFLTEIYMKKLMLDENQIQIDILKGQIQKHLNLEFQLKQKIYLLELQNFEFRQQFQRQLSSSSSDYSNTIEPISEEIEDLYQTSTNESQSDIRQYNRMYKSLVNGLEKHQQIDNESSFELMKLAHEKQIFKYEKQIKNIKEFYENKIKYLRRSFTPNVGKTRSSISVIDEYICTESISCQSQVKPQNLRNMLREQFNYRKSNRKMNDTDSFSSVNYFIYPENSKKSLNGQDLFIRQPQTEDAELQQIISIQQQKDQYSKVKKYLLQYLPSTQLMKGFGMGSAVCGIVALVIGRNMIKT